MQGVIKAYDPNTRTGVVVCDTDLAEFDLAPDALDGSVFRMLRQGQRVLFDVADNQATRLRLGSEVSASPLPTSRAGSAAAPPVRGNGLVASTPTHSRVMLPSEASTHPLLPRWS